LRHIGAAVGEMLHDALDAMTRQDVEAALSVVRRDKEVDREYKSATRELVTYMMEDPRSISRVMNIMWALRSLERIGDHSRNIAEYVFYMVKGKDLRHEGLESIESTVRSWT
jgi:phosphate transport system protein